MAQKVQVLLIDDLDGGDANETVKFALDKVEYEIDLSEKNAATLRAALEPFRAAARRLSGSGKPFRKVATGNDPKAVRAWAASNGVDCPPRGRIPQSVVEKYENRDSDSATRDPQPPEPQKTPEPSSTATGIPTFSGM